MYRKYDYIEARDKQLMMEEPVLMSDEETSDTEVIFVDNSPPPPSTESRGKKEQPKVVTEEMRIDEQLKELGLYEEGMSMDQKQELLVVLAASRETAEQEESMRQRAIEWERQLFSDVDEISSYDAPSEADDGWKSECSKTTPTAYGRDTLPVANASKVTKTLPVKAEESYAQKVKFAEKAFKMLEVEESSKASESQDQKPVNTTISTDQFYSHSAGLSFPVSENFLRRPAEDGQRGKHHLSRNAYRPLSPSSSKVAVAHPMIRDPVSEMVIRDEDSSSLSPVDFHRIKFKLEKSLSSWEPCTSPVAFDLTCKRVSPKHKMNKETVPFYCPGNCDPKEYTNVILDSFKKYHLLLRKMQARSKKHMLWGEPVKAGRHHLDPLDAPTSHNQVRLRSFKRDLYLAYMKAGCSEVKNKECNEDSVMMNIDKCPEPNSSDSNSVGRTMKSAFRPIKAPLQLVDKENDPVHISDYELHDSEPSKSDTLPRSKSCPSPVASNSDADVVKMDEKCKRTLLSNLSASKQLEDPGGKENSVGFHQWSPFGPSSAIMPNSDTPNFNAFSTFATSKTMSSVDSAHIQTCDTASEKTEVSETENNMFDSQFHVRKDGQKTYSSRPHHNAEKNNSVVSSSVGGTCDNSQEMLGINSQESTPKCITQTQDKSPLQNDDTLLSQIEGGITRKRKCEVRLTRLTPSEIKAASPRKRWKKQS